MNIQEAIKQYTQRGWNIVPLAPNSKSPKEGFQLSKYFNEQFPLSQLLQNDNTINLGLITGKTSGLAVIDVDDVSKVSDYLTKYPTDLVQRTPSGGAHLFYEYNDTFPAIKKIDGGDFFAGNHYVVLAPSRFNNKSYEWLKFGKPGKLTLVNAPLPELSSGKYTRAQILDLVNKAIVSGAEEGQGNDTILYGSSVLLGDGISKEAVTSIMMGVNAKRKRPESEKTVLGMIDRAEEYASRNKFQKPELKTNVARSSGFNLSISSYGELSSKYSNYQASWLVDGWILESSIIMCAAPPERYKTWLSVDLALSVASGLPFLDTYEVRKTGNVLILQQEDFGARYFARFNAVERAKIERAELEITVNISEDGNSVEYLYSYFMDDKIFFHENAEFTLDSDEAIDKLEERIVETKAVLCIIDPFYSLSTADDYFATAASKIRERIKDIRNKTGCAFVFVHHTRKTANGDTNDNFTRNQIFGSQFVSAVMEGTWLVGRTQGMGNTEVNVHRRFKEETAPPTTKITFHIKMSSPNDSEAYALDVVDVHEDLEREVKETLRTAGALTFSDLFGIFGDRFSSKSAFTRWLQAQDGITQQGKRGKYFVEPDS